MKLIKIIKTILPIFTIFALTACSMGKANDYYVDKAQVSEPEIQIPQSYYVTDMEQNYPIPETVAIRGETNATSVNPPREF